MATISKRGSGWFAQVRRKGYPHEHKSFTSRREAVAWARNKEAELDAIAPASNPNAARQTTLGDLVRRYVAEVTPRKRSQESERLRLNKLLLNEMALLTLTEVTPEAVAAYRDARLASVKPATVRRELALLQHVFEVARRDWGHWIKSNPVALIRQPTVRDARDRRLRGGEWDRLVVALMACHNQSVRPVVELAIHTGLRRSEILGLEWRHINWSERTAHVPLSKNGHPRTIPLTDAALAVLGGIGHSGDGRVFSISANAFRLAWERTKRRAGIVGLRFHDLRHEAISRFAELGLNVPELAVISGHRDPRMLFRYTHIRAADLATKLNRLQPHSG
jgi:integrase